MPETAGPADYFFWTDGRQIGAVRSVPQLSMNSRPRLSANTPQQCLPCSALFSSPPAAAAGQYLVIILSFLNVFSRVLFARQGDDF